MRSAKVFLAFSIKACRVNRLIVINTCFRRTGPSPHPASGQLTLKNTMRQLPGIRKEEHSAPDLAYKRWLDNPLAQASRASDVSRVEKERSRVIDAAGQAYDDIGIRMAIVKTDSRPAEWSKQDVRTSRAGCHTPLIDKTAPDNEGGSHLIKTGRRTARLHAPRPMASVE